MKTFLKLLAPLALAIALRATAADEPAAPAPATNKPARAVPTRVNVPPPATVTSNATATVKPAASTVAPAAATNAAPAPAAAAPSPQNKTPVANLPTFPAPGVTVRAAATNRTANAAKPATTPATTTATPAIPGAPQPATGARANVAGAPAAGGNANAPGGAAAAGDGKGQDDDNIPAGMIKFQDADMMQVLDIYQELTGRTVLRPTSLPGTKISIKTQTDLTRAEAILALDSILSMNGVTMVPQGTKFVKAVAEAQAGNSGAKVSDVPFEDLPESGTYVTHVVQLTNASPNDIMQVLTPFSKAPNSILTIPSTGMIVLRDYAENVKRMLEMIARVDVVPVQEFESVVIPIKYALAGDIAQVLGGLTAGGGSAMSIGGQRSNTGLSSGGGGFGGGSGGGFGNTGGGLGGLGGNQGYGNQGLNRLGGQTLGGGAGGLGGGAAGRGSFANRLQQIANQGGQGGRGGGGGAGDIFVLGNTKIIADERINALLIFASKSDLQTISNIIDKLDVVLAQVVIEAIVMQVSLNNKLDYGFSYLQNPNKPGRIGNIVKDSAAAIVGPNTGFLSFDTFSNVSSNAAGGLDGGFNYIASFAGFDATLKALASDGRIKILQRPRIQTSHAVEANLFVGQTRPYPTGSSYGGFGGNYSSIQQLQIGVTLSVLPLINAEGLVVMDIRQKIQDVGDEVTIQNIGSVPSTIDREANAKVAVRDGETVMLGGMISANKSNSKGGVPLLKDIPYLGALFRSTRNSDDRTELAVLIRPTVLPTPEAAANFAKDQRRTMPATTAAQRDFDESERKLADEEEKRAADWQKKEEKRLKKKEEKEGFSK